MDTDAQYFATIAGRGVTIFVSSGDGGSNPNDIDGAYDASVPVRVESPANDPSVTAVGGTSLTLNVNNGTVTSETVWFGSVSSTSASGGGQSHHFPRLSWQPVTGTIPALGNGFVGRLVPDVSLVVVISGNELGSSGVGVVAISPFGQFWIEGLTTVGNQFFLTGVTTTGDLNGVTGGLISGNSIIAQNVGCYGIILRQTTQLGRVSASPLTV